MKMSDTLKIENERGREQSEKLLRNCSAPCMIPSQLKISPTLEPRRKSENSLLGSFHRIRASFGSKDGPNGVALSRWVEINGTQKNNLIYAALMNNCDRDRLFSYGIVLIERFSTVQFVICLPVIKDAPM